MPGLVGVVKEGDRFSREELVTAKDLLKYHDWYREDALYEDSTILATRTHLGVVGERESPFSKNGLLCWVEGEIYNLTEMKTRFARHVGSFPELLIEAYRERMLEKVLAAIDGYYVAVIYDKEQAVIKVISDRYGFKPVYFWHRDPFFGWASEIKAFLAFQAFEPVIRKDAYGCFMQLRHMIGDITWFENVSMLSAASILTYEIKQRKIYKERYWLWSSIKPQKVDFMDAALELARLLKLSVDTRTSQDERIIVSLSGGLDSRALLASCDPNKIVGCYTYGKKGAHDVEIAEMAAKVKGCHHKIFEMSEENWLGGRVQGVWKSDGMRSFVHMHEVYLYNDVKEIADINFNGFAGDLVAGGGWISRKNKKISKEIAFKKYKDQYIFDSTDDEFYDTPHEDPYHLNNRVRRGANMGSITGACTLEQRKPFFDDRFIEFIYALPDEYRVNGRLYNAALLRAFPEYYETIPWQKLGAPISKAHRVTFRIVRKAKKGLIKFGLVEDRSQFVDYKTWIREPRAAGFFQELLESPKALYRQYTDEDYYKGYLLPHLDGRKDYWEEIGRATTVEIWLQQVFNKKYRD